MDAGRRFETPRSGIKGLVTVQQTVSRHQQVTHFLAPMFRILQCPAGCVHRTCCPELLESGGNKYWLVRTASRTLVYPFEGGESLVKGEGDKRIRPDSKITVNEKGSISGVCYDGKERTFRLGQ